MLVAERLCEKCNILPLSTSVENGHTNHYRGFVCSMKSFCLDHTIDVHLIFEKSSCKNQIG